MSKGTRIVCTDLSSGESEEQIIRDDWCVIVDGMYVVSALQRYRNGTVQLTLRRASEEPEEPTT